MDLITSSGQFDSYMASCIDDGGGGTPLCLPSSCPGGSTDYGFFSDLNVSCGNRHGQSGASFDGNYTVSSMKSKKLRTVQSSVFVQYADKPFDVSALAKRSVATRAIIGRTLTKNNRSLSPNMLLHPMKVVHENGKGLNSAEFKNVGDADEGHLLPAGEENIKNSTFEAKETNNEESKVPEDAELALEKERAEDLDSEVEDTVMNENKAGAEETVDEDLTHLNSNIDQPSAVEDGNNLTKSTSTTDAVIFPKDLTIQQTVSSSTSTINEFIHNRTPALLIANPKLAQSFAKINKIREARCSEQKAKERAIQIWNKENLKNREKRSSSTKKGKNGDGRNQNSESPPRSVSPSNRRGHDRFKSRQRPTTASKSRRDKHSRLGLLSAKGYTNNQAKRTKNVKSYNGREHGEGGGGAMLKKEAIVRDDLMNIIVKFQNKVPKNQLQGDEMEDDDDVPEEDQYHHDFPQLWMDLPYWGSNEGHFCLLTHGDDSVVEAGTMCSGVTEQNSLHFLKPCSSNITTILMNSTLNST